jgi:ABC-type sugar transport system ATPase subunit
MVASFVGHPAMNLWEAAAERGIAVAGALRIPVHVEDAMNGVVQVRLGIRPEDVRIAPEAEGARTPRPGATIGTARLVERTGSQTWVTVELTPVRPADSRYQEGRQFIIGLAEGKRPVHPGASVMVWLDRIRPYVFDADRGARLPTRAGVMAGTGAS